MQELDITPEKVNAEFFKLDRSHEISRWSPNWLSESLKLRNSLDLVEKDAYQQQLTTDNPINSLVQDLQTFNVANDEKDLKGRINWENFLETKVFANNIPPDFKNDNFKNPLGWDFVETKVHTNEVPPNFKNFDINKDDLKNPLGWDFVETQVPTNKIPPDFKNFNINDKNDFKNPPQD